MIVKALSVRQPWAWAIVHAGKDVENRNWPTPHRGRLAKAVTDKLAPIVESMLGMRRLELAEATDLKPEAPK